MPKWSVLFLPVQQCGGSAGIRFFSRQTDSLSSCNSRLLKYADDFMLCNSYSKCSDQEGLDDDLSRLATWSTDHVPIINTTKCVECLFYSTNTPAQLPFSFLNGKALSRDLTVKYLGVHFTWNMTWSTHIDTVFTKCLKLSFSIRRLRSINVYKCLLWEIVSNPAIHLILPCSTTTFRGFQNIDFTSAIMAELCISL